MNPVAAQSNRPPQGTQAPSASANAVARSWLLGAALVAMTLLVYRPTLHGGFVWDDDDYVTKNLALRSLGGLERIWLVPAAAVQYYPLVFTSFLGEVPSLGIEAFRVPSRYRSAARPECRSVLVRSGTAQRSGFVVGCRHFCAASSLAAGGSERAQSRQPRSCARKERSATRIGSRFILDFTQR
jgi:hypothetical protein